MCFRTNSKRKQNEVLSLKIKKILMTAVTCITAAISTVGFTVSAAETQIPYTSSGQSPMVLDDDGTHFRFNIYNVDGANNYANINNKVACENNISVTFTISGLQNSGLDQYAVLYGTVGANKYWNKADDTVTNQQVSITGNGQYTAVFNLIQSAKQIDSLVLYFNIDVGGNLTTSGIGVSIDNITTGGSTLPTLELPTNSLGVYNIQGTTPSQTGAVLGSLNPTDSSATGDSGIAIAVAGLVVTAGVAAAAIVFRKKDE